MTRNRRATALAVLLAFLAGLVDALGFLRLNGAFVSFMSGNSTRLGVGLGQGHGVQVATVAAIIATFGLGAMAGAVLDRLAPRRKRASVLLAVSCLLFAGAICHLAGLDEAAVGCMAVAMGVENAVFVRDQKVSVGLTYVTGALVKTAHGLVAALFGGAPLGWLPDLLLWGGLVLGGVCGTALYGFLGLAGLWVAGALALAATGWVLTDDPHLGDAS